ncbi:2-phospho-L-lactate guanylyltransferase [Oerskovia sp. NPDC057915]|uniref:2-phospho-L-lactate guanylyltransferase n=1 Tax=Oerskovia sp. NPDC057915 TaxID=3346280 RepID=UPI0036DCD853
MIPDGAAPPAATGPADAFPAGQRVVAVVPLRDGSSGKSRLATVLDPAERSRLVATLARHVVGTLLASEAVERVLVVTSDPRFTWRALGTLVEPVQPPMADAPPTVTDTTAEGDGPGRLQIVLQPASRPGLNAALDVGREIVASLAGDPAGEDAEASTARPVRLLVAHADLPALTVEDVEALIAEEAPVVVATDRTRSGTNLLVLDVEAPFTFRFGVGSLDAHLAEAERRGLRAAVVQRTGTAVDLDTLDDWSELPADVRARPELSDLHRAGSGT